jgi:hypothetical protein
LEPEERLLHGYSGPAGGYYPRPGILGTTTQNPIAVLIAIPEMVNEGLVRDAAGKPVTTPEGKKHLYVVGDCGKISIALEHEPNRNVPGCVKHDTLSRGAPTFGAGEIYLHEGRVIDVNNDSGTYRPAPANKVFIINLLERANVQWVT